MSVSARPAGRRTATGVETVSIVQAAVFDFETPVLDDE